MDRAVSLFEHKRVLSDGHIVQVRIWSVPSEVPGSKHRFKYSLFYGRPGQRIVLYDNERPKGDHRHYGDVEEPYRFVGVRQLVADFLADVAKARGEAIAERRGGG